MKKLFLIIASAALLLVTVLTSSCTVGVKDQECAEDLVKAIAKQDVEACKWWITIEDVHKLKPGPLRDKLEIFAKDRNNILELLSDWKIQGEKAGINWNDVVVDSVSLTMNDYDAGEALGCDVEQGFILLTSDGKKFRINYEQAVKLDYGDPWKTIMLTTFLPLDKDGKVISDLKLKQDGTFEDFFISLAECFKARAVDEIDKCVLRNDKGEKVLLDETMDPTLFVDDINVSKFLEVAQSKNYEATELNTEVLSQYGMFDRFGLDKKEIQDNGAGFSVKGKESIDDVLSGDYMKYKGKWYLISML